MENLIFGAFATLDGYREGDAANLGRTVYDRCTVVALCSAKAQNPACTVALLTNAPVPEPFRSQLTQGDVEIWDCPFTTYRVPADTNWALAYYKLCAMAWVLENHNFARAAMLDLDTFTQRPLDDLWRECDEAVLLYQVPHAASQTMTAAISRCFDAVEPDGAPHTLTHFGGELVAGSRTRLTDFISLCRDYFEELQAKGITPREGDEAIWCGAAYRSLPERHIKHMMQTKRDQRTLNDTKNQGSEITGSCNQTAQRENAILDSRPDKVHQNTDTNVSNGRNNRYKTGAAKK